MPVKLRSRNVRGTSSSSTSSFDEEDEVIIKKTPVATRCKVLSDSDDELNGKEGTSEDDEEEEISPLKRKKNSKMILESPSRIEDESGTTEESPSKRRLICCEDGGGGVKTPKAQREKRLQALSAKITQKKSPRKSGPQNKEKAISDAGETTSSESENMSDFIVENEEEDSQALRMPDSEKQDLDEGPSTSARKVSAVKKRRSLRKNRPTRGSSDDSGSEAGVSNVSGGTEGSDSPIYSNPYLDRDENDVEAGDDEDVGRIMDRLSKHTDVDLENTRRYKKELGKIQLEVHSITNRSLYCPEKRRRARNLKSANFDTNLKKERNLGPEDAEYWETESVDRTIGEEKLRIFPRTGRICKYNGRCAIGSCGSYLESNKSNIVGAQKFCSESNRYRLQLKPFIGDEGLYWICSHHLNEADEGSSSASESDIVSTKS